MRIRTREWRAWLEALHPGCARSAARRARAGRRSAGAASARSCSKRLSGEPPPPARPPRRVDLERRAPAAGPGRPAALGARARAGRGSAPVPRGIPVRRLVSDLTRAVQTADLLGLAGAPTDPRWREIDIGEWAGFTLDELDPERVAPGSAVSTSRARRGPSCRRAWARQPTSCAGRTSCGDPRRRPRGDRAPHRRRRAHARAARQRQPDGDRARRARAAARLRAAGHPAGDARVSPSPRGCRGSRSTASSRAARHPRVLRRLGGRRRRRGVAQECSIAAITAAASSGVALEPCSSRRGRRFTAGCCRACASGRLALGEQRLGRGDDLGARLVRDDDVVDVAALGRRVGVGEARTCSRDQLVAALFRRGDWGCRAGG